MENFYTFVKKKKDTKPQNQKLTVVQIQAIITQPQLRNRIRLKLLGCIKHQLVFYT